MVGNMLHDLINIGLVFGLFALCHITDWPLVGVICVGTIALHLISKPMKAML